MTNADQPPFRSGTFTDSAADDGAYWNVRKFPEGAAIALSHEHDRDIDVFMDRDNAVAFDTPCCGQSTVGTPDGAPDLPLGTEQAGRIGVMLSLRRQGFNPKVEVKVTRPGHRFTDASVWKCGARIGRLNASIPMAIVTFDQDWLRVEGVPTYDVWVDRRTVSYVQPIRYLWGKGIRFVTDDGRYDGLIIWTRAGMAEALRSAGW